MYSGLGSQLKQLKQLTHTAIEEYYCDKKSITLESWLAPPCEEQTLPAHRERLKFFETSNEGVTWQNLSSLSFISLSVSFHLLLSTFFLIFVSPPLLSFIFLSQQHCLSTFSRVAFSHSHTLTHKHREKAHMLSQSRSQTLF